MLVQTNQTFPSPEVVGEVASSNLHGLEQRDMIIISAPSFGSAGGAFGGCAP